MSFVKFSPLFLSACIQAWVGLNKVALGKCLSWFLGAGLKEVVPFYQGKTITAAHQQQKVQKWPRSRLQLLDLHMYNYTNCSEVTADLYQEKNQAKRAAPTEVKESHCIRKFAGGHLCLICVFEKRETEGKCFRPSSGFKTCAYANLEHQKFINVEGAFEDELWCAFLP